MGNYRKLWWTLIGVLGVTFCLLGWFGREVYREAPPIPDQVTSADGKVLFTEAGSRTRMTASPYATSPEAVGAVHYSRLP